MARASPGTRWIYEAPPLLLAALAIGVAARILLLAIPPIFVTDVSFYNSQAVGFLLRGLDPYGAAYTVPPSLATPGAADVFAYLPGAFAFLAPGNFGTGARLGLVACDLVVAASLLSTRGKLGAAVAAVYLLLPPTVVFSTSFLNDSLPAIAFLSAAAALERTGRSLPGAAMMGLALASSQESWFVFPVYAAYCLRRRSFRLPVASLVVAAATLAPFIAWGPGAFAYDTLLFQFQRLAVPLFSQGPFGLNVNPSLQGILLSAGGSAPLDLRGALAVVVIAYAAWRWGRSIEGFLLGSAVTVTACLFLLSGDFFWSYLELPFVLLLFWAGVRYGTGGGEASMLKGAGSKVAEASE